MTENKEKNRAKVSICIPAYNNAAEVGRLLSSIVQQEYKDFEINISDDSTDGEVGQIVEQFMASLAALPYPPIHYRHNPKPFGHIFNWNAALRMASGEYIKIMFSDDWFTDSTSLGSFVALLDENPNAALAFSGSRQVMLDKGMQYYDRCAGADFIKRLRKDYRLLFLGNQIGAPSASIYRRGSELTLFDEESNWASDMYLYFDLLMKSSTFAYTTEPLVSIGVHDHQYTESFSERDMRIYNDYRYMYTKYRLQECEACRRYFLETFIIKYHKGPKEAQALGIGSSLYWKKWFSEQKETVQCFIENRFKKIRSDIQCRGQKIFS